ncbi:RNB domain-containing ribonuclease [Candidatus Fermentibacterales bacterium]|nr:RNB domain-containing ribonuclease [Candidatus Fermentibacterales bacterium]
MSGPGPDSDRFEEEVVSILERQGGAVLSMDSIRKSLDDPPGDFSDRLEQLVSRGVIWPVGRRSYALPSTVNLVRGRIRLRRSGSAVLPPAGEGQGPVEIDRRRVGDALDGDLVMVRLMPTPVSGRGRSRAARQGRVLAVLERKRTRLSGVLLREASRRWFVRPLDPALPESLPVRGKPPSGTRSGCVVLCDLDFDGGAGVIVRKALGDSGSPHALIDGLVAGALGPETDFPDRLVSAAEESASRFPDGSPRKDLRDWLTLTIDPADARDFDDAVSVRKADGEILLGVHIADVALFVTPGSDLDEEAYRRATSTYLPDRVIPMLPEALSAGACSLRPGEDRPARSVLLRFREDGELIGSSIERSVIRSSARLTYEEVQAYLTGQDEPGLPGLSGSLGVMKGLATALASRRRERGGIDLGSDEYGVVFDEEGWPSIVEQTADDDSHRLVEMFMVQANSAVAEYCRWSGLPVLYRVHPPPGRFSGERLKQELSGLGIRLPGSREIGPSFLQRVLDEHGGGARGSMVREMVLRSLSRAVYSPRSDGHFGLALRDYMHFTSPIRRYPDLLVHQVLAVLDEGSFPSALRPLTAAASHTSEAERDAEALERSSIELMALLDLSRRTGEVFGGVVTGSTDFGAFIRLEGLPVEGLLHVSRARAVRQLQPGSEIRVEVTSVDVLGGRVSLAPA